MCRASGIGVKFTPPRIFGVFQEQESNLDDHANSSSKLFPCGSSRFKFYTWCECLYLWITFLVVGDVPIYNEMSDDFVYLKIYRISFSEVLVYVGFACVFIWVSVCVLIMNTCMYTAVRKKKKTITLWKTINLFIFRCRELLTVTAWRRDLSELLLYLCAPDHSSSTCEQGAYQSNTVQLGALIVHDWCSDPGSAYWQAKNVLPDKEFMSTNMMQNSPAVSRWHTILNCLVLYSISVPRWRRWQLRSDLSQNIAWSFYLQVTQRMHRAGHFIRLRVPEFSITTRQSNV